MLESYFKLLCFSFTHFKMIPWIKPCKDPKSTPSKNSKYSINVIIIIAPTHHTLCCNKNPTISKKVQLVAIYYLLFYCQKLFPPPKNKRLHIQVNHHSNSLDFYIKFRSICKITVKNSFGQLLCLYVLSLKN